MQRRHLFEFCDQAWLPESIRLAGTEFLAIVMRLTQIYRPTVEVLLELLESTEEKKIIVLGAGSGGGIVDLVDRLPSNTKIVLTDLFPDQNFKSVHPSLSYHPLSVDAFNIPPELNGIRVMYTTFHHFKPVDARRFLENVVHSRQPVAIFEATERSLLGLLTALFVPILVFVVTPWAPFRWSRLLWTYVIPVLPLAALWDGIVSNFRTYSVEELKAMVSDLSSYDWGVRTLRGPHGEKITSLKGAPKP